MNPDTEHSPHQGFTLVELLVALAVGLVLMTGIYQLFIRQQRSTAVQDQVVRVQQEARVAETLLAKTIQLSGSFLPDPTNATTVSMRGQSILAATDRYITLQYDDPLNTASPNVVGTDEVVTFAVSKTPPTVGGGTTTLNAVVHFDKNGDGTITDADQHNLSIGLDQSGPPYNLYRITPNANGTLQSEVVASNVDNLVFRYYDRDGQPLVLSAAGQEALANAPLDAAGRAAVRSVQVELVLRTRDEDPERAATAWTDFPPGSVVTRDASGDVDAGFTGLTDSHRRRKFLSRITPRSLAVSTCGRLELKAATAAPACPAGTVITATVYDQYGQPAATTVEFTASDGTPATASALTASGAASFTHGYTGLSKPVRISAEAEVSCTTDGGTSPVTLHNSIVVNYQPGTWHEVELTPASGTFDTCPAVNLQFETTVRDQCGNSVPPDPGMSFAATLASGVAAPIGTTNQLQDAEQTFTVSTPTAAGPWGTDPADYTLTVQALGVPPAGGIAPASFDVTLRPWPPAQLLWAPLATLPAAGYEDCPSGPQDGAFYGEDCHGNPVFDTFQSTISVDPLDPDGPTGAGDQGALFSENNVTPGNAADLITVDNHLSGSDRAYQVAYTPPTCTINPDAASTAAGITPTVTVEYLPGITLNGPVTVSPCRDSCGITASVLPAGVQSNPLDLTACEVPATLRVAVTRCQLDQKQVRLNLRVSGGNATAHLEDAAGSNFGAQLDTGFQGNNPSVAEAYLVIEGATAGSTLEVTADYLDASGTPYWTCDTLTVNVDNTCRGLAIYTDPLYTMQLTGGADDCLTDVDELYVAVEDCRFTSNRVWANAPDSGLWVHSVVNGAEYDREPVDLDPQPAGPGGSPLELRSALPLPLHRDDAGAAPGDGVLSYPSGSTVHITARYIDPNDPADNGCAVDTALAAPLPVCFPNAITSGGGAGWNGNFKVHWGDVVVRGNISVPSKFIEKSRTGQFNGSGFGGTNYSDRFVDVYAGKAFPGDTSTGNYTGQANPDPATPDQPFLGGGYGNYFRNLSYPKITEMIVEVDYDTMKFLAQDRGVYWYVSTNSNPAKIRNPDHAWLLALGANPGDLEWTLEETLDVGAPNQERYRDVVDGAGTTHSLLVHDGDFLFVDAYGGGGVPGFDGAAIDALATADLPTHRMSGNFYTEGVLYIAGNVEFTGLGSTTDIPVYTPPEIEAHYDHNTAGWFAGDEGKLPIRSDANQPQRSFTIPVHLNGAFYADGILTGNGNPSIYGSLTTERGYQGSGTPEIWYNYNLNVSGMNRSLCVDCCIMRVAPDHATLTLGSTLNLTAPNASGAVQWDVSANHPDVPGQTVATVNAAGQVSALSTGWVQVRARDPNNCVAFAELFVGDPCTLFSDPLNIDPAGAMLPVGDTQRFTVSYAPSGVASLAWGVGAGSAATLLGSGTAGGLGYADVLAACGGETITVTATDPACPLPLDALLSVPCPSPCDLGFVAPPGSLQLGGSYTLTASGSGCGAEWGLEETPGLITWVSGGSAAAGSYVRLTSDAANPLQAELEGLAATAPGNSVNVHVRYPCDQSCGDTATFTVGGCPTIAIAQNPAGSPLLIGSSYEFTASGGSEDYSWQIDPSSSGSGTLSVDPAPDSEDAELLPTAPGEIVLRATDSLGCEATSALTAGCQPPTVAMSTPLDGETYGALTPAGTTLEWRGIPDDHIGPDPIDQIHRVEFRIDPLPPGYGNRTEFHDQYCGFGGTTCTDAASLGDVSAWPDGSYTLTATAYTDPATHPCGELNATGQVTIEVVNSTCMTIDPPGPREIVRKTTLVLTALDPVGTVTWTSMDTSLATVSPATGNSTTVEAANAWDQSVIIRAQDDRCFTDYRLDLVH